MGCQASPSSRTGSSRGIRGSARPRQPPDRVPCISTALRSEPSRHAGFRSNRQPLGPHLASGCRIGTLWRRCWGLSGLSGSTCTYAARTLQRPAGDSPGSASPPSAGGTTPNGLRSRAECVRRKALATVPVGPGPAFQRVQGLRDVGRGHPIRAANTASTSREREPQAPQVRGHTHREGGRLSRSYHSPRPPGRWRTGDPHLCCVRPVHRAATGSAAASSWA